MFLNPQSVPIIVTTYHRPRDTDACLNSIINNTSHPYRLYIIDNSSGKINNILSKYERYATIFYEQTNVGKGRSIMKHYWNIEYNTPYLITIDGDIVVPPDWLNIMRYTWDKLSIDCRIGALAPAISNTGETFAKQLATSLTMHKANNLRKVAGNIYYNKSLAGPLLMIDRSLFENADGYLNKQIYAKDDSKICFEASKRKMFLGIVGDVLVQHSNLDSDAGYIDWKLRNFTKDVDCKGYWD